MRTFMSILLLLGGTGVFLAGMGQMSAGLRKSAGGGIRRLFDKITGNSFAGYSIGIGATAIVQSSSATTIMTVGFANARIINTRQGASIILGAKVGTTLTAFLFVLSETSKGGFSTGNLFSFAAFAGAIMLMIAKTDKQKNIATFLLGFGMLFLGLEVMGMAISDSEGALSSVMGKMFKINAFNNALLLIIIGTIFTCIIQSSTAATGIYLTFLTSGVCSLDQAFFLMLGANIGTCADGLMASIGGSTEGKRLAFFHFFTSTIGATLFGIITVITRGPLVRFFTDTFVRPNLSLAVFNLSYNLIYTLILLPFLSLLIKLMEKIIKDKSTEQESVLEFLNPQILRAQTAAIDQMRREILSMAKRAFDNLVIAFDALMTKNVSQSEYVFKQEERLNMLNREISNYLIKMSSTSSSLKEEVTIGAYHHVINDIERIGDHAKNFMSIAVEIANLQDGFTGESCEELTKMFKKVETAYACCLEIFDKNDTKRLNEISALENEIDAMQKTYTKEHFKRLHDKSSWAEIQVYYDIISELERIGDHIVNVAFSTTNPIGQEDYKISITKKNKKA